MSEEKQRGGGPQSLRSGMGVQEPSSFVSSKKGLAMQEMLNGCSNFSRGKEFRNRLLPFRLSPEPTKAERELSMICAGGEPVSPELMHEAAADVWKLLLKWSLNWWFQGRKVRGAGASPQPAFPRAATAAQQAALLQLKLYVEDFVRALHPCHLPSSGTSH